MSTALLDWIGITRLWPLIKDGWRWYKNRNKINEIQPFILPRPGTGIEHFFETGKLQGSPQDYLFSDPNKIDLRTKIERAYEVVYLLDKKTKQKIITTDHEGNTVSILLRKITK